MVTISLKTRRTTCAGKGFLYSRCTSSLSSDLVRDEARSAEGARREATTKCVSGVQGRSPWDFFGISELRINQNAMGFTNVGCGLASPSNGDFVIDFDISIPH